MRVYKILINDSDRCKGLRELLLLIQETTERLPVRLKPIVKHNA